ncbi:MAG TPA: ABC transporter permease [Bacteroidales bacterium]|nr:ABC transporter permease [Bacteroidales bacterium]
MLRYFSAFRKEGIIILRDLAGMIVLFVMPMIMIIILSLVQEFGWNAITTEPKIKVLYVDEDHDSLASMVENGLIGTKNFDLVKSIQGKPVTGESAREEVRRGNFQIGVIIPAGATRTIREKIRLMVTQFVSGITMPVHNPFLGIRRNDSVNIAVFFDPSIKGTFKNTFMSAMKEFSLKIESQMIFQTFNEQLRKMFPQFVTGVKPYSETVYFTESYPSGKSKEPIPNSTQHNVPSWAIFAMFFIVIPLTSSIIKEREEGSLIRLHTLPVNYITIFMAKVGVYLIICFIQFLLMVLAGMLVLPLFGLPPLNIAGHIPALVLMAIVTSLAALGYGILIGTLARTHQQAAAFGSVSVVILTALGGLWVPIYFMPSVIRMIASWSPLNWAHSGFMDIFLRGGHFSEYSPEALKLLIFFAVTIGIAMIYRKIKSPIAS